MQAIANKKWTPEGQIETRYRRARKEWDDRMGGAVIQARNWRLLTTGGAPLRIVQSLLGHSTIRMTERYAHLAPGQSAGFMHLLSTVPSKPSTSGQRSGQFDPKSDPN